MTTLLNRAETASAPRVRELVHRDVVKIVPDALVRELAALLVYYGLTSVPVVERTGRLLGIVSASDILQLCDRGAETPADPCTGESRRFPCDSLDDLTVGEIMLPALYTLPPTATIPELVEMLERTGMDRVLVVEGGNLTGVVTTADLVRVLAGMPRPSRGPGVM